jgi:hypothetical protein
MNIYEKLQRAKKLLGQAELKKSGHNKFANFHYYELSDFMPEIIKIFENLKLYSKISFTSDYAMLTIINAENPDESEEFMSPMVSGFEIKGSNAMQTLGGIQTYQRRYLYMSALDITESDHFDSVSGKKTEPNDDDCVCEYCLTPFMPFKWKGKDYTAETAYEWSIKKNGKPLCKKCADQENKPELIDTGETA